MKTDAKKRGFGQAVAEKDAKVDAAKHIVRRLEEVGFWDAVEGPSAHCTVRAELCGEVRLNGLGYKQKVTLQRVRIVVADKDKSGAWWLADEVTVELTTTRFVGYEDGKVVCVVGYDDEEQRYCGTDSAGWHLYEFYLYCREVDVDGWWE